MFDDGRSCTAVCSVYFGRRPPRGNQSRARRHVNAGESVFPRRGAGLYFWSVFGRKSTEGNSLSVRFKVFRMIYKGKYGEGGGLS